MEDKTISEKLEEHNQAYLNFLTDVLDDRRKSSVFQKVIIGILSFINLLFIIGAIVGFVKISIYCQNKIDAMADRSEQRMYEFLSEYDFSNEIDLNSSFNNDNSGNINVTR